MNAAGLALGNSLLKAAQPVLRILFATDRTDRVSSGKRGIEGAVLRLLAGTNDIAGPRVLNKNPNARGCSEAPGYYGTVAALVFPQGIEQLGGRVQLSGKIQTPSVPTPPPAPSDSHARRGS